MRRYPPLRPPKSGAIPLNSLAFDIDGVVADIMTTFLDLARKRYNCGHHLRYEHITAFRLEDCLDLEPDIIRTLIRELIDRPHELAVEPIPQAVPVLTRLARETPLVFVTARDRAAPIKTWLHRPLPEVPPKSIRVVATGDPAPNSITSWTTASTTSWKTAWKPASNWLATASPPSCSSNPGTAGRTPSWKSPTGPNWPPFSSKSSSEQ